MAKVDPRGYEADSEQEDEDSEEEYDSDDEDEWEDVPMLSTILEEDEVEE